MPLPYGMDNTVGSWEGVGSTGGSRGGFDRLVRPMEIEAMEVYTSAAGAPMQFVDFNSTCGVILIWTRK